MNRIKFRILFEGTYEPDPSDHPEGADLAAMAKGDEEYALDTPIEFLEWLEDCSLAETVSMTTLVSVEPMKENA